jgi:cellulose synthase/poly-beta-1,6-N-acetylglucosamine synthase-like glycosyltransferase
MSTSDANHLSGSPVLRSPEQEIALSAVICTYNRYDLLPEAIESLVKQDVPADLFEIIVVDKLAGSSWCRAIRTALFPPAAIRLTLSNEMLHPASHSPADNSRSSRPKSITVR